MLSRARVHELLEGDRPGDIAGPAVRRFLTCLILLNVAAVVLETVASLEAAAGPVFTAIEVVSVGIFSLEYVLRGWAAPEQPAYQGPFGRLRWMRSSGALVDLLAVLPCWLPWLGLDLRSVRLLRLLRILRVAKLGRYSHAVQTLQNVLRDKAADLTSLLVMLVALLVVCATIMFHFENDAQPNAFSSIPATMWWGIVTLTTIGYGDMSPVTPAGRAFGGLVAVLGIAMFALPAGLLGAAFVEEIGKARRRSAAPAAPPAAPSSPCASCPHCGKPVGPAAP
ncbi:MAG: potassium channel family protein [Planctomycetes bacterium]|nr:potassium channel family protein [Planctomycetota bacterium]